MKRYSIMVRYPRREGDVELCQCDSHPGAIKEAAQKRGIYEHVYIRENEVQNGTKT